ncbi:Scr1 family TA system antitoxin-like transcriptional regulator [Streptomyces sp. NPDC014733]|uniref:Scr1 family TA system antitoxin-like transcriptional regulator n=1 Tax=Streptomyces sp. NPDC014733 TaxID=3364885 RepID=UPI0037015CD5
MPAPAPVPSLGGAPPPGRIVATVALRTHRTKFGTQKDAAAAAPSALHAASPTPLRSRNRPHGTTSSGRRPSNSSVSRLERAQYPLDPHVIRKLLTTYGVDPDEAREITHLAGDEDGGEWTGRMICDCGPRWYQRLSWCEQAATTIRTYADRLLPAVVRTPAYAHAISIGPRTVIRAPRGLPLRRAASLTALLDYQTLARPVGTAAITAAQMNHLLTLIDHGAQVHVLPHGGPPIWEWGGSSELAISAQRLFVQESYSAIYHTGAEGRPFIEVLDEAQAAALPAEESRQLIAAAASRFRDEAARAGTGEAGA